MAPLGCRMLNQTLVIRVIRVPVTATPLLNYAVRVTSPVCIAGLS